MVAAPWGGREPWIVALINPDDGTVWVRQAGFLKGVRPELLSPAKAPDPEP